MVLEDPVSRSLPISLDIAKASDPLHLARQLLALAVDPISLDDMIGQLYETPGEDNTPVAHGLPSMESVPVEGWDGWLADFVEKLQYLYQDSVSSPLSSLLRL